MVAKRHVRLSDDYSAVAISAIAAIIFLLFQLTLIFSVVTFPGTCMFTLWQPDGAGFFSPFWITFGCVLSLLILALLGVHRALRVPRKDPASDFLAYGVAVMALVFWLFALRWFWLLMEYERDEISLVDLQQRVEIAENYFWTINDGHREAHICRDITAVD
ncbi:MAG: hypothetical protein AAGM16_12805 [Pseudomonadota bacterium]